MKQNDWLNWQNIGLKCGLEIHAQLEGKKLFCNCPTLIRDSSPHFSVKRHLRSSAGETGHIDIAAMREMQKEKYFIYEGYVDSTCLIELDEEPPRQMNKTVFTAAIQAGTLLNMRFVDELHIMRKTIVDGSNTSSFQRTALIAQNGTIGTSEGTVTIASICIEEDACRIIRSDDDSTTYSLDRLGIPLLEIATGADIKTPEQALETAESLGMIVRSTGVAKRGLGTIRQDVNVSIRAGARVEIKGAQELKLIPELVRLEALRQQSLLTIRNSLCERNASVKESVSDVTSLFTQTSCNVIRDATQSGGIVLATKLCGFAGLLGREVQPKRRLGTELSDRAKTYAGIKGLFHSDELPGYSILPNEVSAVKNALSCEEHDGFILIAAGSVRAKRGMIAALERAQEALLGVPSEVRKANSDGTTSFLRPMPGANRMYPETDVPTILITKEILAVELPELLEDREKRYVALGLGNDLARLAARSEDWKEFEILLLKFQKLKPAYVAEIYFGAAKTIERTFKQSINPSLEDYADIFAAISDERISKESVLDILREGSPVKHVLSKYRLLSDDDIERTIRTILSQNKGGHYQALIGIVMKQLRGKASGQKVSEILTRLNGMN